MDVLTVRIVAQQSCSLIIQQSSLTLQSPPFAAGHRGTGCTPFASAQLYWCGCALRKWAGLVILHSVSQMHLHIQDMGGPFYPTDCGKAGGWADVLILWMVACWRNSPIPSGTKDLDGCPYSGEGGPGGLLGEKSSEHSCSVH